MIEYLMEKGGYTSSGLTIDEKKELEDLRKEVKKYREIDDGKSIESIHSDSEESNNSEDEKETDEEIKKRRERKKKK